MPSWSTRGRWLGRRGPFSKKVMSGSWRRTCHLAGAGAGQRTRFSTSRWSRWLERVLCHVLCHTNRLPNCLAIPPLSHLFLSPPSPHTQHPAPCAGPAPAHRPRCCCFKAFAFCWRLAFFFFFPVASGAAGRFQYPPRRPDGAQLAARQSLRREKRAPHAQKRP